MKKNLFLTIALVCGFVNLFSQKLEILSTKKISLKKPVSEWHSYNIDTEIIKLTDERLALIQKTDMKSATAVVFDNNLNVISESQKITFADGKLLANVRFTDYAFLCSTHKGSKADVGFLKFQSGDVGKPTFEKLGSTTNGIITSSSSSSNKSIGMVYSERDQKYWESANAVEINCIYHSGEQEFWDKKIKISKKPGESVRFLNFKVDDDGNMFFLITLAKDAYSVGNIYTGLVRKDAELIVRQITIGNGKYFRSATSAVSGGNYNLFVGVMDAQYNAEIKSLYCNGLEDDGLRPINLSPNYTVSTFNAETVSLPNELFGIITHGFNKEEKRCLYAAIMNSEGVVQEEKAVVLLDNQYQMVSHNNSHYVFYTGEKGTINYIIIGKDGIDSKEYKLDTENGFYIKNIITAGNKTYLWSKSSDPKNSDINFIEIQ